MPNFQHFDQRIWLDGNAGPSTGGHAQTMADARRLARSGQIGESLDRYTNVIRQCASANIGLPLGCPKPTFSLFEQASDSIAADLALPIEACRVLAEDLVNFDNDFITAKAVLIEKARRQRSFREALSLDDETIYLGEDWVCNIGHIGSIQYLIKAKQLGLITGKIVVAAPCAAVANLFLLRQYEPEIALKLTDHDALELAPVIAGAGLRFFDVLHLQGMGPLFIGEACNVIEGQWRATDHPPVLTPMSSSFDMLGIPEGRSYVCLHVRESGYHGDDYNPQRSADVDQYREAIQVITTEGDMVVRMGDPSMKPLRDLPGVIDYAHSPHRSAEIDVRLAAACRFFVGTTSGLMYLPHAYGRRCLITNYSFVFGAPPLGHCSRFLPKLVRVKSRLLPFDEMVSDIWMRRTYLHTAFTSHGAAYIDNSAEDIASATLEMYLDGAPTTLQRRLNSRTVRSHQNGNALIANSFADKYRTALNPPRLIARMFGSRSG